MPTITKQQWDQAMTAWGPCPVCGWPLDVQTWREVIAWPTGRLPIAPLINDRVLHGELACGHCGFRVGAEELPPGHPARG